MASKQLLLNRLGKTPDSSTYHLLYRDSYSGSFNSVETLTGQNAKPLCDTGRPSPADLLVFDGSKMDLQGLSFCGNCRSTVTEYLEICKELRAAGVDPHENIYEDRLSLTGLRIDHRNLTEEGPTEAIDCPVPGCDYSGMRGQVIPHMVNTKDGKHNVARLKFESGEGELSNPF